MNVHEILRKKRDGFSLEADEIERFVGSLASGEIPDYVASAFLMAVFIRGMNREETFSLTHAMMNSGEVIDPGSLEGKKIDKHSTGGVGDKVSLVLVPLVAACGVRVPMISGRGLAHTGGTLDKLESIPNLRTDLTRAEFTAQVNRVGAAIMSQSAQLVPADMKLYALRDVTGTVESIPLITASILSKKLAEGIDGLVMDIKLGSGAFMRQLKDAEELAQSILQIGREMGKDVVAFLTDMNQPLGQAVGNAIEVRETVESLRGEGPADLMELVFSLGEEMLVMAGESETRLAARETLQRCIQSGKALEKLKEIVAAQGGDERFADDVELLGVAKNAVPVESGRSGYVQAIDTFRLGSACVELGGGRRVVGEEIDRSVGLIVEKRIGASVEKGEALLRVLCDDTAKGQAVAQSLAGAFTIGTGEVEAPPVVIKKIDG